MTRLSALCPLCGAKDFSACTERPSPDDVVRCDGCGSRYTYGFLLNQQQRIAEIAYFLAQQRGFAPGREEQDWLEAEASVLGRREPRLDARKPAP
jgi:hypothetical protein